MALFSRQETTPAYSNSRDYKPFLRSDFRRRCAYCERPEDYMGGEEAFEVEHFKPRSKFPELDCLYANLYYACGGCNRHKSETWPSVEHFAQGNRFADPCEEDPYLHHLVEADDGTVRGTTPCGTYTAAHIRLHRADVSKWRRLRARAIADVRIFEALAHSLQQLRLSARDIEREVMDERISALYRYIEGAKVRFGIG